MAVAIGHIIKIIIIALQLSLGSAHSVTELHYHQTTKNNHPETNSPHTRNSHHRMYIRWIEMRSRNAMKTKQKLHTKVRRTSYLSSNDQHHLQSIASDWLFEMPGAKPPSKSSTHNTQVVLGWESVCVFLCKTFDSRYLCLWSKLCANAFGRLGQKMFSTTSLQPHQI